MAPPVGPGARDSRRISLNDSKTWLWESQSNGVWRTTDSGTTWKQLVANQAGHGGGQSYRAKDGTFYLAVNDGVFRSPTASHGRSSRSPDPWAGSREMEPRCMRVAGLRLRLDRGRRTCPFQAPPRPTERIGRLSRRHSFPMEGR